MQRRTFLSAAMGLGTAGALGWGLLRPAAGELARGPRARLRMHAGADLAFGTEISVRVLHDDARVAELAIADALAQARTVDALMSIYRPGSQVHTLNRDGCLAQPSPHLLAVLKEAARLSALSDGAFDITVQPLWDLARQGRDGAPALSLIGWRRISADASGVILRPGMAITLNGIAQGYALDLARAALAARGIRHALIDTGEFGALGQGLDSRRARPAPGGGLCRRARARRPLRRDFGGLRERLQRRLPPSPYLRPCHRRLAGRTRRRDGCRAHRHPGRRPLDRLHGDGRPALAGPGGRHRGRRPAGHRQGGPALAQRRSALAAGGGIGMPSAVPHAGMSCFSARRGVSAFAVTIPAFLLLSAILPVHLSTVPPCLRSLR